MAWRPYENLINGELENRTPGKVKGWIRFFRNGKPPLRVTLDLAGDFHEDIRGRMIRFHNPTPSDRSHEGGTYMQGFARMQRGTAGDITAGIPLGPWTEELARKFMAQNELVWDGNGVQGPARERRRQEFAERYRAHIAAGDLCYPYVDYPYLEWYADNGRVVLELDPSQVEVIGEIPSVREGKTPAELQRDEKRRNQALESFLVGMVESFSQMNRKKDGDGNVTGDAAQ